MLEKQMIKFILSKWNYGNFRIVFWDQEEFVRGILKRTCNYP